MTQPEPSPVRRFLEAMASYMERPGNCGRLLTRIGVASAFSSAAAKAANTLPKAELDETCDRVTALLPDTGPVITHGGYALLLRKIAEGA